MHRHHHKTPKKIPAILYQARPDNRPRVKIVSARLAAPVRRQGAAHRGQYRCFVLVAKRSLQSLQRPHTTETTKRRGISHDSS